MAAKAGQASIEIDADLQKLFASLERAKQATVSAAAEGSKHFAKFTAGIAAATAGMVAYVNRSQVATAAMQGFGKAVAAVSVGMSTVVKTLGQAALMVAGGSPLGVALTGALLGHPILGAAAGLAVTQRGQRAARGIGSALSAAGAFAARAPLLAAAGAATGLGVAIAGISLAAKAGSAGIDALKDAFKETRKETKDLSKEINELKESADKLSKNMPEGNELREAQLRRLGNLTGGLTSPFAQLVKGEVSSEVIREADDALKELTLRFGDHQKAAVALAEALKHPERAMQALRDAGIRFTAEERKTLESTRTFTERLQNAAKVLEIIERQAAKPVTRAGFVEFMEQLGTFLGSTSAQLLTAITDGIKNLISEISRLSGLTFLITKLDEAFRSLGKAMELVNKRLFPETTEQQLENVRARIADINKQLEELKRQTGSMGDSGIMDLLTGGAFSRNLRDVRRRSLEESLAEARGREGHLLAQEAARREQERIAQLELQNSKIQDQLQARREELRLLQAGNRAQLEASRIAAELGVDKNDPRVKELARLNQQIEDRRRAIAQAGQLTVFERENMQLTQQIQLFRFGNQEMEIRNKLLQIELQAAQRRQQLTPDQKKQLEDGMKTLQRIKDISSAIENAFTSAFGSMADALAEFAATGKFEFKQLADTIVQQLVRIALQATVIKPLIDSITGFFNPMIASAISPGSTTSAIKSAGKFAEGGSFTVPGGATGDQPYLIGLSAGERVDVTPSGRKGGPNGTVINTIVNSSKDFNVSTQEREGPGGVRIIDQVINEVGRRIGRGDLDNTFGARFGMTPRMVQR
jgi:lambda family phage tail tape measure protein